MITVAIVAILAAIAVPMYQKYVKKSRTSEATANLGAIAMYEETYYSENDSYISAPPNPTNVPKPTDTGGRLYFNSSVGEWASLGRVMGSNTPVYFQYEIRAGQYMSGTGGASSTATLVNPATSRLIGTNGGDVANPGTSVCSNASTGADALGIPTTPSSNWYYVTAAGNQDGDSTCSIFIKVIDRPDVVVENDIE